jgi:hypothetical protein
VAKSSSDRNKLKDIFEERKEEVEEELEEITKFEKNEKEDSKKEEPKKSSNASPNKQKLTILLKNSDVFIVKDEAGNGIEIPITKDIKDAKIGDVIAI